MNPNSYWRSLLMGGLLLTQTHLAFGQTLTAKDGLQFWLKADAGVTATGGKVSLWKDQSGKGNDVSQTDAASQPTLVTGAANGNPVVHFDGTAQSLEAPDSPSLELAGDITTFFVTRFTDFGTYRAVWAQTQVNQPGPNDWYALPNSGIPRAYRGNGQGQNGSADGGTAMPTNKFVIAGWDMAGTVLNHYFSGVNTGGRGNFNTSVLGSAGVPLIVGSRQDQVTQMKGDIAEILIYNRALTAAERANVVAYLGTKYIYGTLDPAADGDKDGLTNAQELALGTDPTNPDSDGDGWTDGDEVNKYKTDPLNAKGDADKDGLSDVDEVNKYKTDPSKADTDGDGFSDYYEVHVQTDPLDKNSFPKKTTINAFTGPDAGQGLDLTGTFLYAISFGADDRANYSTSDGALTEIPPFGKVHDATFTSDSVDGFTVVSSQVANNWNVDVNYGNSPDQQNLSSVLASIRSSDAANATADQDHRAVTATFSKLQVGASYKMQLLFAERLWARGFNVLVDGRLVAKEFAPYIWQGGFTGPGGATPRTNGVVITTTFVAHSTNAVVVLDGRPVTDPLMGDHNAIINGATLELVAAAADTDKDGLWDAWEMDVFGDLTQTGTGDTDKDGLTNAQEFTLGTDPNKADSDGDGLADGDEVNKYKTDPLKSDSDDDGLSDGAEVNTYKSDPLKTDTDGDGLSDYDEVTFYHTDPTKAGAVSVLTNIVIGMITGGDPGEGLDLQGNFKYAVNVSSAGAAGKAGDADFTADTAAGVNVIAGNNIPNWDTPDLGTSAADVVIGKVLQSIRYTPNVTVELSNLVPESTYKLQLLFYEQCCAGRGFNIYIDGNLLAADFSPPAVQGGGDAASGVNNTAAGSVVTAEILTHSDKMRILLTKSGVTDESLTDPNSILDGFTLETLKEGPVTATLKIDSVSVTGGQLKIQWSDASAKLQNSSTVNGTYTDVVGAASPYSTPTSGKASFYRLKK